MYTKHCIKYLKLQRNLILTAICSQNIFQICIFIHLILYNLGNLHAFPHSVQFSSVTQLCLTLCDPMDCSMPGFPVYHQLPELTQTHVHWVSDAIQPSHPLSSASSPTFNHSQPVICFFSHLQSFPASESFPVSHFFASGGQTIGVSASASVFPMNIQD